MHTQNLANSRHKYLFVFWTNNANNVYLMFFSGKIGFLLLLLYSLFTRELFKGDRSNPLASKGAFLS